MSNLASGIVSALERGDHDLAEALVKQCQSLRDARDALEMLEKISPRTATIERVIQELKRRIEVLDYDYSP